MFDNIVFPFIVGISYFSSPMTTCDMQVQKENVGAEVNIDRII